MIISGSFIRGAQLTSVTSSAPVPPTPPPVPEPTAFWINTATNPLATLSFQADLNLRFSVKDPNGNIYSASYFSNATNTCIGWTRFDSTGNLVGSYPIYYAPSNAVNMTSTTGALQLDSTGNVYLLGSFGLDAALFKTTSQGNVIYAKRYVNGNTDIARGFVLDSSNANIYIASDTRTSNNIVQFSVMKVSANTGNIVWQKSANVPGQTTNSQGAAYGIDIAPDGNIVVSGRSRTVARGTAQCGLVMKINPEGNIVWQNWYTANAGSTSELGRYCKVDSTTGNIFFAGQRQSAFMGLLLDSTGNIIWQKQGVDFTDFTASFIPSFDNGGNVWVASTIDGVNAAPLLKFEASTGANLLQRTLQFDGFNDGNGRPMYFNVLFNNDYSGFTLPGGGTSPVGNLVIARLPSNGAGTGNYVASGNKNISYYDVTIPVMAAGNLSRFPANMVFYNSAVTAQDISNLTATTGTLTLTKTTVS